mgnify:CR=1 FL=1
MKNYIKMFSSTEFWRATWNTLLFCILTVPGGVLLALVVAVLLNSKIKGKVAFRAIFFLPMVVSPAAVAMVWKWMFNSEYGIINTVFHTKIDWITNPNVVIITVAIVAIWSALGYDAVLLLSGIQNISKSYYEAASLDGCTKFQQFRYITMPMVSPTLFVVLIMRLMASLKVYDLLYMMVGEGNPAPSLPEFIEYSAFHRKSLSVKPGIIGFWQAYSREHRLLTEEEQSEYDQEYILNWTVGLDLRIIFRAVCPLCRSVSKRELVMPAQLVDEMRCLSELVKDRMPLSYDMQAYQAVQDSGKPVYRFIKRLVDIAASLLGLIVLSPVFIILAVIIRMSDGGSVFYGHTRVGYKGKKISVYKFRSMKTNAGDLEKILTPEQLEQYVKEFKIDNDPRITKIGGFLRKTSLDELPQLINILKGELSIVGPRPIVEKETEIYGRDIAKLLSVKPGLTGYWQAYARNNATYESGERQRMEMYYVEHCSLWLDIKILFRTVFSVIREDGAQ